ncbi:hypothetical protein FGO68_gene3887 [Halteria grandinella]|uniref:Uncharacterized protein n=1 Tax=Halteria grandinella TaxID=5974 RepID=A0A8J8NDF0_HALGN|nr:hypothetical protein FGO68_gene3887 [Halteria grandinella]
MSNNIINVSPPVDIDPHLRSVCPLYARQTQAQLASILRHAHYPQSHKCRSVNAPEFNTRLDFAKQYSLEQLHLGQRNRGND